MRDLCLGLMIVLTAAPAVATDSSASCALHVTVLPTTALSPELERVSGQFHVACGMLHLFGHALPETHRRYLLAESFTDYWRRINIYW